MLAQVSSTIPQFPGVSRADVVQKGNLLELVLSLRGEQPNLRCFPETDHLVGTGFLKYWQIEGGLFGTEVLQSH